jgi:PHD/YefM family antitoxin component YafN of YafNO toxin-antitoxin module
MTVQMLKVAGKRFVIVSEKDFRRLQEKAEEIAAQDRGDVAEAKRRKARGPSRPYADLRKKLGLG